VAFEMLPEPFDRIETGAVSGQVNRYDVVPVQALGLCQLALASTSTTHDTPTTFWRMWPPKYPWVGRAA
jgi:hypothetical protein